MRQQYQNKFLTDQDVKELLPYAKQALFVLNGFIDIIDELNYGKEKFEELIFTLDDDYDMLYKFSKNLSPVIKSHNELAKISSEILDKLMIAQRELGLILSQNEHNKI